METLVGITDLRTRARELIDTLDDGAVTILRHNKPVAVLISPARIEELLDRIEDLEDQVAVLEHRLHPDEAISLDEALGSLRQHAAT